jgi:hypothetical protein
MTEDEFWIELEFRICRELSGMSDAVLRLMCCDGIGGDFVRFPTYKTRGGQAYLYGTIYIGKTGQTAMEFRMALPHNITSKDDIVWSKLMPPEDMTAWLSVDYSKRKLVMIDLSRAEPIVDGSNGAPSRDVQAGRNNGGR